MSTRKGPVRRLLTIGHSYVVTLNRRLARELAAAGSGQWDVTVVAPSQFPGDLGPMRLAEGTDDRSAYRLIGVPVRFPKPIHLMHYRGDFAKIVSEEWDLIYLWEEPYVLAGFETARRARASAKLVFWTSQNLNKWYPPPFSWFEKAVIHRANGWTACGQTVVDVALERNFGGKPHLVTPYGVDTELFRPNNSAREQVRKQLGWEVSGPPVVGFVGRFVPEKGITLLLESLERIDGNWRMLAVGGGPLERNIRSWAERFPDRVRIVCNAPHERMSDYLNAMDVLCAPSQTTSRWREQFGRMVAEAMATGVAVIGSDSGEIPHTVGDAGVVVGERDVSAWSDAIATLLDEPQRRQQLAAIGRDRAQERFAWPVVARRTLAFFNNLVDGGA